MNINVYDDNEDPKLYTSVQVNVYSETLISYFIKLLFERFGVREEVWIHAENPQFDIDLLNVNPKSLLKQHGIKNGCRIELVQKKPFFNYKWKPFLKSVLPQFGSSNVPVIPDIRIDFQYHRGKTINTKSLACGNVYYTDRWLKYIYTQKTNKLSVKGNPQERIILVKLNETLVYSIIQGPNNDYYFDRFIRITDKIRYNVDNSCNQYRKGDTRSWYVFTDEPWIDVTYTIKENKYLFKPNEPLEYSTWYAIVFLHTEQSTGNEIYEDIVWPFKTTEKSTIIKEESNNCIICLERPPELFYLPCQHLVCCEICDKKLPTRSCPVCRSFITKIFAVYGT